MQVMRTQATQLTSRILDLVLESQDKNRREAQKEASLAIEIKTLSSAVEGRNYPQECEKRLAERARAIQAKMDNNLQTMVAQEQAQQEVEDDRREKGAESSSGDDTRVSTIRSRLQELRRGINDRTPNRSPSRAHSNSRIGHLSHRSLPSESRSSRSSLEVPAAGGTCIVEDCGPPSRCGVFAPGREAQPLRRISSGYIGEHRMQSPHRSNIVHKDAPQGILPPSPVPGSRRAMDRAASTEGTLHSCNGSGTRTLSARSIPCNVPPVPLVGCLAKDNVVSGTISEESTGLSVTTRPSSRGSPGVSLQVRPGPDQSMPTGTSWQFQAADREHVDSHQHVQHHVVGPPTRISNSLPKAPSQWRAQPGQVQVQAHLQAQRRPSLVLSMPTGAHSQTQSANTSPRQSVNVRLGSPSSTATQQVPSPRPWGMRPPGCSAEVQVTWHGQKVPRQLSGSMSSHQMGTSMNSRTNSVC